MANIKSQIKRNRSNERRRLRNQGVRSELKTRTKVAMTAIDAGDETAPEAMRLAQKRIDKAAARAGKSAYNDYIEEWRREQRRCGDDIETEVSTEAERLEAAYDKHRLAELIQSGGVAGGPALPPAHETPIPRKSEVAE